MTEYDRDEIYQRIIDQIQKISVDGKEPVAVFVSNKVYIELKNWTDDFCRYEIEGNAPPNMRIYNIPILRVPQLENPSLKVVSKKEFKEGGLSL